MAEAFEFQDLRDAVFWGVNLQGATFRDVDMTGARVTHSRLVDVAIDAEVDRLTINGVDVTSYVNERDPWYALRSRVRPSSADDMRDAWPIFDDAWESAISRAAELSDEQRHASVDGEWSFVQTLRHLVFATDKWCTVPILGGAFHPMGQPNSGSVDFPWPGLDRDADPTFDEAVAAWRDRWAQLRAYVEGPVSEEELAREVDVLENGLNAVHDCIGVVFEEHFQHYRYATRDLDRLE